MIVISTPLHRAQFLSKNFQMKTNEIVNKIIRMKEATRSIHSIDRSMPLLCITNAAGRSCWPVNVSYYILLHRMYEHVDYPF